jgi:hypothetical protein
MFARGVVSLHTAHLPVPKTLTSKSRVSITYKLIQNKGLQVYYFGHLGKTGGRGSYRMVHTTQHPAELRPRNPVRPSQKRTSPLPAASANLCALSASALEFDFVRSSLSAAVCRLSANGCLLSPLFLLHTQNRLLSLLFPLHTQKQGDTPPQKCWRADILDFSPYISHSFQSHTTAKKAGLKTNATGQRCRGTINRALFSFIPPAASFLLFPLREDQHANSCHRYLCNRIQSPVKQERSALRYQPASRPRWRSRKSSLEEQDE